MNGGYWLVLLHRNAVQLNVVLYRCVREKPLDSFFGWQMVAIQPASSSSPQVVCPAFSLVDNDTNTILQHSPSTKYRTYSRASPRVSKPKARVIPHFSIGSRIGGAAEQHRYSLES